MPGKIGDYVHLLPLNYYSYGINRYGQKGGISVGESIKNQHDKLKSQIDSSKSFNSESLEAFKGILNGIVGNNGPRGLVYQEAYQTVLERLKARYGLSLGEIRDNILDIVGGGGGGRIAKKIDTSVLSEKKGYRSIKKSTVDKAFSAILKYANAKQFASSVEVQNMVNNIRYLYLQVYDDAKNVLTPYGAGDLVDSNPHFTLLVNAINDCLDVMKLPTNEQSGMALEYLIEAATVIGSNKAQGAINDMLAELKTQIETAGDTKSKVTIDAKKFTAMPKSLKGYNKDDNGVFIYSQETKDKVDVFIELNDGTQGNVNAKNFSSSNMGANKGIHFVKQSPLTALIQDENPDFITHWMNQEVKPFMYNPCEEEMKLILTYKALVGYKEQAAATADLFIGYDKSTNQFIVKPISEIMNKIMANPIYSEIAYSKRLTESDNEWQPTVPARLANLITALHQIKVSVTLDYDGV